MNTSIKKTFNKHIIVFVVIVSCCLTGCLGGGAGGTGGTGGTSGNSTLTPSEIAAITPSQIEQYSDEKIIALGTNIRYLSDATLIALSNMTGPNNLVGQVESISVSEIVVLTPAQVRLIGASGPGGSIGTSLIAYLNAGAWAALTSVPSQVAAITPAEIATLWDTQITGLGTNIQYLSNEAFVALTPWTGRLLTGQIESISVKQIAVLTPAQVRLIGAAGPGGSISTSMITYLNSGTWAALVSDPLQMAAITPPEIATFGYEQIIAMGTDIQYLSDAALSAISIWSNVSNKFQNGQMESLTVAQITALSPSQITLLAGATTGYGVGTGIAFLNVGAFGSLSATQVAVLTPSEVIGVSAALWASLSDSALAGFSPATIASLTAAQKSLLSSTQHAACGC
jgi:hypothetical protein